eukprot:TRINITY_DN1276_c0_g1_i1.p1 TRINITY_DN1276_c0_g1~~TRINITY_DN1276_c0_g1_i1.p1  ORF type:complete len:562 (-),score=99.33 TRINITY_DN1276_c0_g1_i1:1923-3608(-)
MSRFSSLCIIFGAVFATLVAAQPAKPFGRGAELLKPLPPAKDPSLAGASEECAQIRIRTLSGRCTSAVDPALGEARRAQFSYFDVNSVNIDDEGLPSPRLISNIVSDQETDTSNSQGLNEVFTFFGQFIDHDFALSPLSENPNDELEIEVPEDDPDLSQSTLEFTRSEREAIFEGSSVERPITVLSSALDLSTVYGVDEDRNAFLRVADSCRLKTSSGNLLPFNTGNFVNSPSTSSAFFIGGDTRVSETPMLTVMHTIWVREHNRLCDLIEDAFPDFTPEQQHETARAVNIAQYQKIVYDEWLPAILGSPLPPYAGYQPQVNPTISLEFTTAAFRLGHTLVGTDVTRIDSGGALLPPLAAKDMFFIPSAQFTAADLENFVRGATATRAQEFDAKVVDILRNFLFENVPEEEGIDLIALNLQRSRDHNVAKFNQLREFFIGSRASSFADISSDPAVAARLEEAYGDVNLVEAWIGLMAEDKAPGSGVGRTLGALMRTEFGRLRDGDQFFFLLRNQIPTVVLDNIPEIRNDLFARRTLFNRILLRNTNIASRFLSRGRNAFLV